MIKRLSSEIHDLLKTVDSITVTYEKNKSTITFPNNIRFELDNNYPFCPPRVWIKDIPYKEYRINHSSQRIQTYYADLGYECLCCCTMIKTENWSPIYQMSKVLEEIDQLNAIKQYVKYKIATEEITKHHELPQDIGYEIESFLYANKPIRISQITNK